MVHRYDGYNWILRFSRGEELVETLLEFVKKQGVDNCWVSGIGGAELAEIGFYKLGEQKYSWHILEELLEVVSLQGNIVGTPSQPQAHLHGVFAKDSLQTVGGHVKRLVVGGTCELMLHRWYGDPIMRQADQPTGLKLLQL